MLKNKFGNFKGVGLTQGAGGGGGECPTLPPKYPPGQISWEKLGLWGGGKGIPGHSTYLYETLSIEMEFGS